MAPNLQDFLDSTQSSIKYRIIKLTCQTVIYGVYLCLVPIVIHVMLTNGLQSRTRKWLFAVTTSTFALATLYWVLSVVFTFLLLDSFNSSIRTCSGTDNAFICLVREIFATCVPKGFWLSFFDDILLINYIIADSVIVWRAWVLCPDQSRFVLMIPVVMLGINTAIYLMTIALRATEIFSKKGLQMFNFLIHLLNATQVAHLALSLLINISATSIIALKAWKYRKLLIESGLGVRTPTQAIRILALLVESGMIYILFSVTSLVSITILLHVALPGLSTVFFPVGIQLVGIYPIVVVLLVEKNRSLSSTYSSFGTIIASDARGGRPSQTGPITFAPRPVASGGQRSLTTNPQNTPIHVSFDSTLEPGDAGMGAGSGKDSDSSEEHAAF